MVKFSDESESFNGLIFGFLEEVENHDSSQSSYRSSFSFDNGESLDQEDEDENNVSNVEESKAFWESQEDLLKTTLFRTTSIETKIRQAIKEAFREINSAGVNCVCRKRTVNACRSCTMKEISDRLQNAGYNCVICMSKWRHSPEIPSGEHNYMEVVHNSGGKGEMKIIIELNFKAQFEMVRSSKEYDRLINILPEVFVGKFSRLQNLVKILCCASKKCMKEKKMHMAPWRKHKYMLAKWQGSPEQKFALPMLPMRELGKLPTRPRASMLTFDLLEKFPSLHSTTMIRVV